MGLFLVRGPVPGSSLEDTAVKFANMRRNITEERDSTLLSTVHDTCVPILNSLHPDSEFVLMSC